jgi:phosphoribosylformylglycinamidine synthase
MIRAQVIVRPRASIFDPQGDAVQRAIQHLGVAAIRQAHVGKFIELELDATDLKATRAQLETICRDLLSNPVIEDYALTIETRALPVAKKKRAPLKAVKKTGTARPGKSVKKAKAKASGLKKKARRPSAKVSRPKKGRKK